MAVKEITCINKDDRYNPYERITHVGGVGWRMTQRDAIDRIERREDTFFVNVRNDRVNVIVAISRFENKYLKTQADGDEPNNLLSLPECHRH